ncbi:ankyrin repeat-containing domain protein [Flagelloscypha sp. PMI_526]|nr:ankyrin repeat-containing domain protein [Flagelloscypha sp. PMI_526]
MSVRFGQREPIRYTPLHLVASFGLATCVRQLLHGPRPQFAETDDCGRTACSWACGGGYLDVVNILLARDDAEANYQDFDGRSPLLWACKEGHKNVVRSLIARDDVVADKPDLDGRSPLLWACMNGHLDIAEKISPFVGKRERSSRYC